MATLPLRPPQFSDDVAWLPPWLQPNQSTPTSQDVANHELLQNLDSLRGENSQVKASNLFTPRERYKICHLYLYGEESSPATLTPSCEKVSFTLTPSCEKVLHFNLHLSTDITSSIISSPQLHISQDDKQALLGTREESICNIDHGSSKLNFVPPTSNENHSQLFARQTPLSNDAGHNTLEILNSKCAECNDISDAVELSVAASEALVIHKIVQSEPFSEPLSAPAILEVALRVKQARVDELLDSPCCVKDSGNNADILSDLGDSDMEDAYKDVGMSISMLEDISLKDSSTSRVNETPMSVIPAEEKEFQCEWQGDQEVYSNNCSVTKLQDRNPETINLKDLSFDLISLNAPQKLQEEKNDVTILNGLHHQSEVKSSVQQQHSKAARLHPDFTIAHSNHVGINKANDRLSYGFQSRWFGGWTGMEGDACGAMKLKGRKIVPNFFACETSYLSESMDVCPDQNSVVHDNHPSLNASEVGKPVEDLYETATEEIFVSQEVVKDSTVFNDPLCSMVPCSISTDNGDSCTPTNNNNVHQVLDAFKNLPPGAEFLAGIAQTSSGNHDENMGREKHVELDINDGEAYSLGNRQLTSLKTTYSVGENDARLPPEFTKSPIDNDTTKKPSLRCVSNGNQKDQEMKQLSMKQHFSCTIMSEDRKQPPFTSAVSCTTAASNREKHVEDASGRLTYDQFENNAEKGVEQQVRLEIIPTSPLILSHRSRRFKAPKLCVSNVSTANPLEDQAPASNRICHKISKSSQAQFKNLPEGKIPTRKRVRFSDVDFKFQIPQGPLKTKHRSIGTCENLSSCRLGDRLQNCDQEQNESQEVKERLTKCRRKSKRTIFQGLDFLLTGFSKKKEEDIEGLLRKHGGMVLTDIPAPLPHPRRRKSSRFNAQRLPVVLCTKKLQTTRFLYGCAVNAFLLKFSWAYDSVRAGSVLPPDKYMLLSNQSHTMQSQIGKSVCQNDNDYIFDKVGVMLHGTHNFCMKLAEVVKHGRGHVHKSLQWLVQSLEKKKISLGVIVVEDENRASRHLKKCASEQKIVAVPERWIINSLIEGKLVDLPEKDCRLSNPPANSVSKISILQDWSQEI